MEQKLPKKVIPAKTMQSVAPIGAPKPQPQPENEMVSGEFGFFDEAPPPQSAESDHTDEPVSADEAAMDAEMVLPVGAQLQESAAMMIEKGLPFSGNDDATGQDPKTLLKKPEAFSNDVVNVVKPDTVKPIDAPLKSAVAIGDGATMDVIKSETTTVNPFGFDMAADLSEKVAESIDEDITTGFVKDAAAKAIEDADAKMAPDFSNQANMDKPGSQSDYAGETGQVMEKFGTSGTIQDDSVKVVQEGNEITISNDFNEGTVVSPETVTIGIGKTIATAQYENVKINVEFKAWVSDTHEDTAKAITHQVLKHLATMEAQIT